MENKKIKRTNPFQVVQEAYSGQKDFDEFYEDIKIIDSVKKVGDGEDDYIIVKKVVKSKRKIKDVIDADKDSVGVENIIKQVLRTGDTSLLPIDDGKCNVDLVGAPEDLMQLKQSAVDAEDAFKKLPPELTDGLDMASFVNNMSQEKFDAFIKAMKDRAAAAAGKEKDENGK